MCVDVGLCSTVLTFVRNEQTDKSVYIFNIVCYIKYAKTDSYSSYATIGKNGRRKKQSHFQRQFRFLYGMFDTL